MTCFPAREPASYTRTIFSDPILYKPYNGNSSGIKKPAHVVVAISDQWSYNDRRSQWAGVMVSTERKIREFERREQDILSAALELFAGERWESVTVTQIARQAGIGKGTVYKHFASKDEIYARLALDFFNGLLERSRQIPLGDDPEVNMREAFRDALVYHMEHQEYANVRQYVFRAGFWERLSKVYVEAFERLDAEFGTWANEGIPLSTLTASTVPEVSARRLTERQGSS